MKVVIRIRKQDRARAWGFLVRHSPGSALPNNTFIVSESAARGLRNAGIDFAEITPQKDDGNTDKPALADRS